MGKYRRVTLAVRCQIDALLQAGFTIGEISLKVGFHKTSVYREIKRNFGFMGYRPQEANELARQRYLRCRKPYKLKGEVADYVREALELQWSPEQVAGRLRLEGATTISHECIYQFISRNPDLKTHLRRPRKQGCGRVIQRRRLRENRLSIHERPQIVTERRRIGDWERDGMYGANRRQLLVCTDRKTRYTKLSKLTEASSKEVAKQTMRLISSTGKRAYTITNDNGSEFRGAPLPVRTFYCDPMKPQQRGTVENTIGLLRQWITRKTDLDKLPDEEIRRIELKMNLRPRKCLNYRTPFEAFFKTTVALAN